MARYMKGVTLASAVLGMVAMILYHQTSLGLLKTLGITFAMIFYHFGMRLLVGGCYQMRFHNQMNYKAKWFRPRKFEAALYQRIKVKRWKKYLPTYNEGSFDLKKVSYEALVMTMCQAELVHETIVICSFLPIAMSAFFGATAVFVITSLLAATIDLAFVVLQRYNRPRVLRLMNLATIRNSHEKG